MYGRLENRQLTYAPKYLVIGEKNVWNAPTEEYLSQGWFPLIFTEPPTTDENHYAEASWEQQGNEIVQVWTIKEIEVTADEILAILMGDEE